MQEIHAVQLFDRLSGLPQGPFLDALLKFISSPAGQAIIAALIGKLFPAVPSA